MAFQFPRFLTPRLPQHKRFNFQSRYYDADKERLDKRQAQIARELELNKEAADQANNQEHSNTLKGGWARNHRRHETRKSNGIFVVTLLVLVAAVYLMFFVQ